MDWSYGRGLGARPGTSGMTESPAQDISSVSAARHVTSQPSLDFRATTSCEWVVLARRSLVEDLARQPRAVKTLRVVPSPTVVAGSWVDRGPQSVTRDANSKSVPRFRADIATGILAPLLPTLSFPPSKATRGLSAQIARDALLGFRAAITLLDGRAPAAVPSMARGHVAGDPGSVG